MESKWKTRFLLSCGFLLLITGGIKLVSAIQETKYLALSDPLFTFLSNREMIAGVAVLELAVAGLIFFRRVSPLNQALLVGWLALLFSSYRIGLWAMDYKGPCKCLGGAADWLHVNSSHLDLAMKAILAYFFIGSLLALKSSWRGGLKA